MTESNLPSSYMGSKPGIQGLANYRLQTLVALIFAALALAAVSITVLTVSFAVRDQLRANFRERLHDVAVLASQRIDGDLHSTLVDPTQENSAGYNQIKQVLQDIRDINQEEIQFVYTLRQVEGQVVFVVDAETNPNNISHLGAAYPGASPAVLNNISNVTGPFVDQDFYTDQRGTFLAGYAPIYTSGGRVDGIISVGIGDETILAAERRTLELTGLIFLILAPLIGFLGFKLGQRLAAPLLLVVRGAERLASGEMSYRIPSQGWHELNRLAEAFNSMADRLSTSVADLDDVKEERTTYVEKRFEYLQTAADVGSAVGAILDPNRLVNQVTNLIQTRFSLYYVGLFLVDETGEWAILRAATGEAGEKMLARGHRIHAGEGMVGWSIANNQARVASKAEQDAVRLRIPELPLTRSEAAIPLRARDRVLGALSVQSDQADAFDQTAVFVLQMLADQVAVALDNARLFAQRQSELEDVQRSYQQLTQSAWDTLLQSRGSVGYRADEAGLSLISQLEGDPNQLPQGISEDGFTLTLPVRVRGQVLGYMQTSRPASTQAWTEEDLTLVESLLDQLGTALDNARLYSATQRSVDRERILSNITGRVRSSTSVDTILQTAVRQLAEALKVPRGSIRLVTGSKADGGAKGSQ